MAEHVTAEAQHQRALDVLRPHAIAISGGAARHGAVAFVGETWRTWSDGTDVAGPVAEVISRYPANSINRADLAELAEGAVDDDGQLRLFIATLIWGRGKSNGRMREHIIKALVHPSRDEVLARTQEIAVAGQLGGAYAAWRLPGLGPAFFTKWLWSSTLRCPPDERGLILDARVWATLNGPLGWSSVVATGGSRRRPERYVAYVTAARRWASELTTDEADVSAEDVEWALFHANGDIARLASAKTSP